MQVGTSANPGASTDLIAPPRPLPRPRDALDGLMEATLFPEIKRYRDSIVDILRVIDGTQIGRELLKDFRTLAGRGKFPSIDCQSQQNSQTQDAKRTHCLLLREDVLTAGAMTVGVPPELEHAPSVLFRLVEIRNVLAADGKDHHFKGQLADATDATDVWMDPVDTCVRFRAELSTRMMLELKRGAVNADMNGQVMPAMPASPENTRATAPEPMPVDNGRRPLPVPPVRPVLPAPPALPARPTQPAPLFLGNALIRPPVHPPLGNESSTQLTQARSGQSRAVPSANGSSHNPDVSPQPVVPASKLSTVSNPYARSVTEDGTSQEGQPIGAPRRVLRWAAQKIQAAKDFLFPRREDPGVDGRRGASPSSAHALGDGSTGMPDQMSKRTSDATSDADESPERPIIREAKVKANHRRSLSIRHRREVDPDHVRGQADASPLPGDRTNGR